VRLSGPTVEWLRRCCNADAADDDLERTYEFPHALNGKRTLKKEQVCPTTQSFLLWWIEFFTSERQSVLEYPLSRKYYPDHPLASRAGARANIAFNAVLRVADQFKGNGFARAVYGVEEQLYRKWKVAEVQLNAIDDGCVVWIKKFGFEPKDPEVLKEDFPGWARMNKLDPTVPERAADYPDSFLRSRQQLHVYKVIR
jgi:hypothetical protein